MSFWEDKVLVRVWKLSPAQSSLPVSFLNFSIILPRLDMRWTSHHGLKVKYRTNSICSSPSRLSKCWERASCAFWQWYPEGRCLILVSYSVSPYPKKEETVICIIHISELFQNMKQIPNLKQRIHCHFNKLLIIYLGRNSPSTFSNILAFLFTEQLH